MTTKDSYIKTSSAGLLVLKTLGIVESDENKERIRRHLNDLVKNNEVSGEKRNTRNYFICKYDLDKLINDVITGKSVLPRLIYEQIKTNIKVNKLNSIEKPLLSKKEIDYIVNATQLYDIDPVKSSQLIHDIVNKKTVAN